MTLTGWDVLLLVALNLLFWIAASFLKPYLGRKGENLATHEDLQDLVDQVKATTTATEGIKSDLSGRLWVSQEGWKLKTDVYVSLLSMLHRLMDEAGSLRSVERRPGVNDKAYFEQMHDMYQTIYFQVAALAREDLGFATPTL